MYVCVQYENEIAYTNLVDRNCKNMFFLSDCSERLLLSSSSDLLESKPVEREGLTTPRVRLG